MEEHGDSHPGAGSRVVSPWFHTGLIVSVTMGIYLLAPLEWDETTAVASWLRLVAMIAVLVLLAWMVGRQVEQGLRSSRMVPDRICILVTMVTVVIAVFASLSHLLAGEFVGLHTKVDALYFAMGTLTTVGFGDITPVGQAARLLVVVQMFFNLVVVTTAISILGSVRSDRASSGLDRRTR